MTPSPKPEKRIKKHKIKTVSIKKECTELWTACIYLRALLCSELAGQSAVLNAKGDRVIGLNAHHIARKGNYRLLTELENGLCLTMWEHNYGVHGKFSEEYRTRIIEKIGQERWEWLHGLKQFNGKTDLYAAKIYLLNVRSAMIRNAKDAMPDERQELLRVYLKQIGAE